MVESCEIISAGASDTEARMLNLRGGDPVFRLHRVRAHEGSSYMVEDSTIPQARFTGLAQDADLSASIVVLAHRYGVLLARADEKVGLALADGVASAELKVAEGTPLLRLESVVYAIDGRPIEWRLASCHLRELHYMAEID